MGKLSRTQKLKNKIKTQKNNDIPTVNHQLNEKTGDNDEETAIKKVYLPNTNYQDIGFDVNDENANEDLVYDPSAYQLYHEFDLGYPCLSFSFLPTPSDHSNTNQTGLFNTNFVSGSQIINSKNNQIIIGSITDIKYKNIEEKSQLSEDDSSEEESEDESNAVQPNLKVVTFPHQGCVNKIATSSFFNRDYVANWSDIGVVNVYDITDELIHLNTTNKSRKNINIKKPLFSFNGHQEEGYALDWSSLATAKLASGSCDSTIALWSPHENTWHVDCLSSKNEFGHNASVECIQWSPNEKDILASSGCDGCIKVWDTRLTQSKPVLSINAHPGTDVNVFSWNRHEPLIVSGDDNGILKVWDLRQLYSNPSTNLKEQSQQSVCQFSYHNKAITSVEWHPTDSSTFLSSSEDDQVVLWDLAVDTENLDGGDVPENVLPQIMFIHLVLDLNVDICEAYVIKGQNEIKECHWHPTYTGLIMSTAFKGFNIFKTISV